MIPKIIFTIWAGGTRMMPEKNVAVFKEWLNQNQGFQGVIYVDKATTPKESLDAFAQQITADGSKIELRDITEAGVSDDYVRYEIDRMTPNYGKSSDLIRYNALYKHGGFYIDSDVQPSKLPVELFEKEEPVFCVDDCGQGNNGVCNDAFLCSAQHPVMKTIRDYAHKNYKELQYSGYGVDFGPTPNPYELDLPSYCKEGNLTGVEWVNRTIMVTGSGALIPALHEHNILPQQNDADYAFTMFDGLPYSHNINKEFSLAKNQILKRVQGNDRSWTVPRLRSLDKDKLLEEALLLSIKSIQFEAKEMGLIRLDYHIHMIMCALGEPGFHLDYGTPGKPSSREYKIADINKISDMLTSRLEKLKLDYSDITNVAWVSLNPIVRMFYEDNLKSYFSRECEDLERHFHKYNEYMNMPESEFSQSDKRELYVYFTQQLKMNENNYNNDLELRINKVINIITTSTRDLSTSMTEENPDSSKPMHFPFFNKPHLNEGREIFGAYASLFATATTPLQQKILLYYLLLTDKDPKQQKYIVEHMGYQSVSEAKSLLRDSLETHFQTGNNKKELIRKINEIMTNAMQSKTITIPALGG